MDGRLFVWGVVNLSKFKKHVIREMKQWEQSQAHELTKIRAAQRHLIYNVVA